MYLLSWQNEFFQEIELQQLEMESPLLSSMGKAKQDHQLTSPHFSTETFPHSNACFEQGKWVILFHRLASSIGIF